ncbi:MAG: PHP domain-containing protein [Ruminococcus sp.]|nr:PHP domain-containing protein [Ruminococcus sp.]
MIDLHTHTRFSDGQYTPEEIVQKAYECNINTLSITDHDTANGVERAVKESKKTGINIISGIEISVQGSKELHILGYGIKADNSGLLEYAKNNNQNRKERRDKILNYLKEKGMNITLEDVQRINNGKSSGRPHFARAIMELGYTKTISEAFDNFLATPEFYEHIERPKPTPEKGIDMIKKAGGIAVLAHPYILNLEYDKFNTLLESLIYYGLCGVECYYSKHTHSQMQEYYNIAKNHNLIVTKGSDFHGEIIKPDIKLGTGIDNSLVDIGISDEEILYNLFNAIDKV